MKGLKNILFDFDGVLVESLDIKTQAFYNMYLPYGKEVAEWVKNFHLENGGVSRFEKFRRYHKKFLNIDLDEHQMGKLLDEFSRRVMDGVVNCNEVVGAEHLLQNIQGQMNLYIITGTPTIEIAKILEKRGWALFFKQAMGSPEKKTHWVHQLLEQKLIRSTDTVFIGDALADYEAAVAGNIPFILREHEDNISLFADIDCPRVSNMIELEKLLME